MNDIVLSGISVVVTVIALILLLVQSIVIFFSAYVLLMGFVGFIPGSRQQRACRSAPAKTFAILIPARDEEAVIGQSLESLQLQNYPSEAFQVYVVADSCTDKTAETARTYGAVVYERNSEYTAEQTKGHALRFLFEQLHNAGNTYDAYIIFDADNVAACGFLSKMNTAFNAGRRVVQGQRVVKNPDVNWLTRLESINHAMAFFEQSGRDRLCLPCRLHGSAMGFSQEALNILEYWPTCLEDATTLQAFYVLHGIHPMWLPDAKVYDEQVISLEGFQRQRIRWRMGQRGTFLRYFTILLWRGILDKDFRKFEQAFYVARLQLPLSLLMLGVCIFGALSLIEPVQGLVFGWAVWLLLLLLLSAYVFLSAFIRKVSLRAYIALALSPFLILLSVWLTIRGWTARGAGWVKTAHGIPVKPNNL